MRSISSIKIVVLVAAVLLVIESALLLYMTVDCGSSDEWRPSLPLEGDVVNTVSLMYDGHGFKLMYSQKTDEAEQEESEKESIDLTAEKFEFEGGTYRGVLLSDVIEYAELMSEKTHIWFEGIDGMMSSIDAAEPGENYILFGERGWEVMNPGYPASSNVKELSSITAVADRPSELPDTFTLKVTGDDGSERVVSPGTLLLTDRTSVRVYHGQSEKSGKTVTVMTTESYSDFDGIKLQAEGNTIKVYGSGTEDDSEKGENKENVSS